MAGAGQVWEDSIERAVRAKRVLLLKNVDPTFHSKDLEVSSFTICPLEISGFCVN
jgi:hypothetical protein